MSGKNPSGLTSYSYEVTFGAGTLGINLQGTRSGKGVYVDSFHRPPDNTILPAEQSGYIKLGDIVLAINEEDVSDLTLSELPKVIAAAKRPVTIKLERGNMELAFADVVRDPRKLPWFMQYLVEKFGIEEAVHEQAKLMLWLECEQFIENEVNVPDGDYSDQALMILRKFFSPESNFSLLVHVPDTIRSAMLTALAEAEERARRSVSSSPATPVSAGLAFSADGGSWTGGSHSGCSTPIPHDRNNSPDRPHHKLYRDAQKWAERDMKTGSFFQFCSSMASARMVGSLRYSPPFVQISLLELLHCDKKSVFLLLHMCHKKRHGILHCYNLLKNRPEENIEGGVKAAEEMLRVAISCVHVLGLDEGRSGIEDLPMLTRLSELLPSDVEQPNLLTQPMPWKLRALHSNGKGIYSINCSYLESLQNEMTLSIPMSESMKSLARSASASAAIQEIRRCLRALRTAILRELSTEIVPKFFASNEFEILLWELDAHKLYLEAESRLKRLDEEGCSPNESFDSTDEDAELVKSFSHMVKPGGAGGGSGSGEKSLLGRNGKMSMVAEVPDGAVQRLLRKVSPNLPSSIVMHRAPLDLLDSKAAEKKEIDDEPMAWLILFDTQGGRLQFPASKADQEGALVSGNNDHTPEKSSKEPEGIPTGKEDEVAKVVAVIAIPSAKGATCTMTDSSQIIPDGITSFLVPSGKCAHEVSTTGTDAVMPPPLLFNMVVATRDSSLMYGSTLLTHRRESVRVPASHHVAAVDVEGDDVRTSGKGPRGPMHTPASIHRSHRPPPHTPKTAFKPLPSGAAAATPKIARQLDPTTPATGRAATVGGYGDWSMSSIKTRSSPFLDRFKGGITTLTSSKPPLGPGGGAVGRDDVRGSEADEREEMGRSGSQTDTAEMSETSQESSEVIEPVFKTVELDVVQGACILTRVPCINALRIPLCRLALDSERLRKSMAWKRPHDGTESEGKLSVEDHISSLLDQMEADDDSLVSLRQCYDHSLAAMKEPTVLRWGGAPDFEMEMILRTLTPKNFVTILIAFILEYKVLVVSSKLTVLTAMGEFLKTIIAPLRWSHVYVPMIPKKISEQILQCPTPFFVGMHRDFFDPSSTPSDVVILDMDSDACRITADLAKALYAGRRLAKELENVLRPEISHCDDITMPASAALSSTAKSYTSASGSDQQGSALREALRLCKLFIADVLVGAEVCCTHAVDHEELVVLFDEDMFSSYKARRSPKEESLFPLDKAFLEQLLRTQSFSLCVAGTELKKLDPDSRPPSRPSSPFVSIPTPMAATSVPPGSSKELAPPKQLFS